MALQQTGEFIQGDDDTSEINLTSNQSDRFSRYNTIDDDNFLRYREPLSRTVCLTMRAIFIWDNLGTKSNRGQTHGNETGRNKKMGTFRLKGSQNQLVTARTLYNFILANKGEPDISKLDELMHNFYDTLLRPNGLSEDIVSCPTDQMIFLFALHSKTEFRCASAIRNICSKLQFCFQSTLVQIAARTIADPPFTSALIAADGDDLPKLDTENDAGNESGSDSDHFHNGSELSEKSDPGSDDEGHDDDSVKDRRKSKGNRFPFIFGYYRQIPDSRLS